jgi:hypothetical protein
LLAGSAHGFHRPVHTLTIQSVLLPRKKTRGKIFSPKGNPTAANLFNIIACLQEQEVVALRVVA